MAYKVFAEDIAAPFSHMAFYSLAQIDKRAEELIGLKSKPALQELINTNVKWALEEKNTLSLSKKIIERLKNRVFYKRLIRESYASLNRLEEGASLIKNKDFSSHSSKQLANCLKKYLSAWIEATVWGHVVNISDFRFNLLSNKILEIIEQKIRKQKIEISPAETFTTLSTPSKRSILAEQELSIFKLLEEIQKNKKLKEAFRKNKNIESELKNFSFWKRIQIHTSKYDWLQYHYLGPTILDEKYFIEVLKGLIKQNVNAQKKIKNIIKKEKETVIKQKNLKNKLGFSKKELYWIKMAREFIYLKGLRKEITFIASRSLDSLLREIAKRFSISFKQLQFMTPDEIFNALAGKKMPSPNLLSQRIKYCVVYYPKGKTVVYIGERAKKLAKRIKEEKVEKDIKELKGTTAFPGQAEGKVAIISKAEDMIKMEKGMILVSPATNPNIMPAIVKASAIITDEGGITCHAAIVSRELKIPCVIGTRIATKTLKDGDKIEVDADKGIVKKLNK